MMNDGVYLSLLAGPVIPVPVPASIVDALISARVTIATTENTEWGEPARVARSGFQLEFMLGKNSPLETLFLLTGAAPPMMRIVLVATINGNSEVIIDGFVQKQKIKPSAGSGPSTLTLFGKDVSSAMDLFDVSGIPYPAMPVFGRVALILAKYAVLGMVPVVIPPVFSDVPDPTERIPSHRGTDFAYINMLASDVGYVFYVDPGPVPGMSKAYWGPEIRVGTPQPALNIDMDGMTNVETLSFDFDHEKSVSPVAWIRPDAVPFPIPVPIPNVSLLNPPLGLIPSIYYRKEPLPNTSRMTLPQAMLFGLSQAKSASESVTADGTLNVARYGRLLKARQLVGVRGAGTAFDGLYYVKSVTHEIKRGEYKQSFSLSRDGIVSTVPRVPV